MRKSKRKRLSRDRGEVSIIREAEYIIGKAQEGDSRVVKFGSIVLFSTFAYPADEIIRASREGIE